MILCLGQKRTANGEFVMKKKTWIIAIILIIFTSAYADESITIKQGAEGYDAQDCIDSKTNDCINKSCLTSENTDCKENCKTMAKEKCRTEGISPPQ